MLGEESTGSILTHILYIAERKPRVNKNGGERGVAVGCAFLCRGRGWTRPMGRGAMAKGGGAGPSQRPNPVSVYTKIYTRAGILPS